MNDEELREAAARYADSPAEIDELVERVKARIAWRLRRGYKVCATCREKKKPGEFGADATRNDGLEVRCRSCRRAANY